MTFRVIYQGIMVGVLTLLAFCIGCRFDFASLAKPEVAMTAQTMAFAVLAMSELVHAYNVRSNKESIFKLKLKTNMVLVLATLVSLLLMVVVLGVPVLQGMFEVTELSITNWVWVILLSLAPLTIVEILKLFKINTLKDE